jgi:DNA topoisomerase I
VDAEGKPITDAAQLERIKSLALPPAWTEVRICPSAGGRLQALGVDKQGKIQYRYHARFVEKRQKFKYDRLIRFGEALPCLRDVTNEHITLDGLPRERVLAVMVRLIGELSFRVGEERETVPDLRDYNPTEPPFNRRQRRQTALPLPGQAAGAAA